MTSEHEKPSLLEVVREGFMKTLGKITMTREAAEEAVQRTVNRLVELGKLTQDEAKNFTNELRTTIDKNRAELEKKIDDSVSQAMHAVRFPKKEEIDTLRERVANLERLIDQLAEKQTRH